MIEVLEHLPGADDDRDFLPLPALKRFAVDRALKIDDDAILRTRFAIDLLPLGFLRAQLVEHRLDVRIADLDAELLDRKFAERR